MGNKKNMTLVTGAPVPDAGRKDVTPPEAKKRSEAKGDINAEEQGKDRIWGVSSRARWDRDRDLAEMNRDSRNVDRLLNGEELETGPANEEEEEDETVDPNDLKVDELKEALTAAGVEFPASAKKPALVQLYIDNNVGAPEGEEEEEEEEEQ